MRQNPERVGTEETHVPRYFYGVNKFVTLTVDVMFVNGLPFLVTLSQKIKLFTFELLLSCIAAQLSSHLTKVARIYSRGGFSIGTIFMDQEFDKVVEKIPEIKVNAAAAREHVKEIKRGIRFIKEQCRGTQAIMKFKHLPKSFMIHLVYFCVMWINLFPATQGISKKLSPHEIVLKLSLIFERDTKGLFVSYSETNKEAVITRKNCGRIFSGIILGPTGNIKGTQIFLISERA